MGHMQHVFDPRKHKIFVPNNIEKYHGPRPIITRSSWELKFCKWLDSNPNVTKWASEPIKIAYLDPISKKTKSYYPDFLMEVRTQDGSKKIHLIEIKPKKQAKKPRRSSNKIQKQIIEENALYLKNQAKWCAAQLWCEKNGIEFNILTEDQLFRR